MAISLKSIGVAFAGLILYFVLYDLIENILTGFIGEGLASIGVNLIPFIIFIVIVISAFTGNNGRGYGYEF